jgi:hypothetical protein
VAVAQLRYIIATLSADAEVLVYIHGDKYGEADARIEWVYEDPKTKSNPKKVLVIS